MSRKAVMISILCGLFTLLVQPTTAAAANPSLVGSWQLNFVPTTPAIPPIPIAGVATFTSDGTVVESDASQVVPGASANGSITYATPGHGIWQLGPAFTSLFVQFISVVSNPDTSLAGKTKTTMNVSLDTTRTKLKGGYTSEVVDPLGNILKTTSGTVTGKLIPHPLLP